MGAIELIKPRKIFDVFSEVDISRDKTLKIKLPQRGMRRQRMFQYRQYLQYKYCMPIEFREETDRFIWSNYSAYKFFKLLYEFFKYYQKSRWTQIKNNIKFNKNKKLILYAAGAIEKAPDGGRGSRDTLKKSLKFTRTRIINPCDFIFNKHYKSMKEFAQNNNPIENWKHMCTVVEGDIAAVKKSHAVVVWIDKYLGTGSHSECTLAKGLHKPVYAILDDNIELVQYPWLMGNTTRAFASHNAFREFILDIQ
jgi:hypothetical protein